MRRHQGHQVASGGPRGAGGKAQAAVLVAHELVGRIRRRAGRDQGGPGVGRHRLEAGIEHHEVRLIGADHPRGDRERGAKRGAGRRQLDRAVLLVHEQVGARLDLGERPFLQIEQMRPGAAAGDDLGRQSLGAQSIEETLQPVPLLGHPRLALGVRRHVLEVAIVGLDAAIAQLRQSFDAAGETDRVLRARHAGAALPDVDLDHSAERPVGADAGSQSFDARLAVDHHGEIDTLARPCEALDHAGRGDRRGDEKPVESGRGHRLRFAHGSAAQTDGAGFELASCDRSAFVRLHVRPQLAAMSADQLHHRSQVVFEGLGVEQQTRGREPRPGIGRVDQRCVWSQRHRLNPRSSSPLPRTAGARHGR